MEEILILEDFFFTQVQLDFGGFDRMKLMNNYNVCKTWLKITKITN